MPLVILFLISLLTGSSAGNLRTFDNILKSNFEVKRISSEGNLPVDIKKDSLYILLTALHYNIPVNEISAKLNWGNEKMEGNLDLLIKNKLIGVKNGEYVPAIAIIPFERGNLLKKDAGVIAKEIADSIVSQLANLKKIHSEMEVSKTYCFKALSFFYLSNILLDNGQINNVERDFLRQERPLRNGCRYYLAVLEKERNQITEPYGIYGNRGLFRNGSAYIAVYGNTRTQLNKGWDNYTDKTVYEFNKEDSGKLFNEMPLCFLSSLLCILEKNRQYSEGIYRKLGFDREISFEEFFIWWYHFIYTETTDILIRKGLIQKPENGLLYYKLNS